MSSTAVPRVIPAQLSFLAIYNPSLGTTEKTFQDQIVFYYSKAAKSRARIAKKSSKEAEELREQENEKLRQVGLAQGMVGFARSFSSGQAVDSVETQKQRIVLHELEDSWWILASIDLTQLPATTTGNSTDSGSAPNPAPTIEYSSREVSPPALLVQQLIRAHSVFLLHHGASLDSLCDKLDRSKFCNILGKYWDRFASNWDVLLHGSPAVDIFGGLKLAAGGELGYGVGEEEWGSGERSVLEDYIKRTDGLVDFMVSRFGETSPKQRTSDSPSKSRVKFVDGPSEPEPWIGSGRCPAAVDGVVFSGVGALSRKSLRDVSHWVESIYSQGDRAYGTRDNPTTHRPPRRRRKPPRHGNTGLSSDPDEFKPTKQDAGPKVVDAGSSPNIPRPIVKASDISLEQASARADSAENADVNKAKVGLASLGEAETWMKYLSLGYGTVWGGKQEQSPGPEHYEEVSTRRDSSSELRYIDPAPEANPADAIESQIKLENSGYFVIGLKGDMNEDNVDDENGDGEWNSRIPLRTLHVELAIDVPTTPEFEDETPAYEKELMFKPNPGRKLSRLRPVVFVHRPFIYTFLFHHRSDNLTLTSFYRNLHTFFSPLTRILSKRTSPEHITERISAASNPYTTISSNTSSGPNTQPIFDLAYDPRTFTVHSSLPNIPDPGTLIAEGLSSNTILSGWSRIEALNVHSQILTVVSDTRRDFTEIERTCKTNRGWWVVWMRLPPSQTAKLSPEDIETGSADFNAHELREAFLVRRARDVTVPSTKSSGNRFGSSMWRLGGASTEERMGGAAAGWTSKGLAEGIGIDARRYAEELLSLNR